MTLLSTLIFDTASLEQKTAWVEAAAKLGEDVVARESEIAEFLSGDFNRVTYLGSGSFVGLAQEAQLKILELAHGLVATSWDSCMGYRHGPKSFVDDKTIVFVYMNNDEYTRQYDLDILNEINGDQIAAKTIAIQQDGATKFDGTSFTLLHLRRRGPSRGLPGPAVRHGRPGHLPAQLRARGQHPGHPVPVRHRESRRQGRDHSPLRGLIVLVILN